MTTEMYVEPDGPPENISAGGIEHADVIFVNLLRKKNLMASFDSVASYNFPSISHGTVYCFGVHWNSLSAGWDKPLQPFVTET